MRKENSTFKTKFLSEAGSKLRNTDYFAFVELENCACYCIADGIDQDKEKLSAKLAVEEAIRKFLEKPRFSKSCLKQCLHAANAVLKRESREMRLEASFLIVVTNYNTIIWGSAGNIRLYHVRNGAVKNKSADLSLSRNLADAGRIPKDKVEEHEERHNLFCYLGMPEHFMPILSGKIKLEDGDTLLLCTKGIWENAGEAEFLDALEDAKEPEEVCDSIEELILSRQKKNLPSYTLTCVFIEKVYKNPGNKKKIIKRVLTIVIPVFVVILALSITLYVLHKKNQKKIKFMLDLKAAGLEYIEEQNYKRALDKFEKALEAVKGARIKKNTTAALEKEELEQYDKIAELMVDAKDAVDNGDYKQGIHYYNLALEQIKEILDFSDEDKEYVKQQKELASNYMDILQYIKTGDKMDAVENYTGAIEAYENALKLAEDIYYAEGKEEASDKLADVEAKLYSEEQDELVEEADEYVEKAEKAIKRDDTEKAVDYYNKAVDLYKQGGEKEKAKEIKNKKEAMLEEKENEEKAQLSAQAELSMNKGEQAAEEGDYDAAMDYYQDAIDLYTQAKETDKIPAVQAKMDLVQSKNTSTSKQEQEAEKYVKEAEKYLKIKDYDTAVVLYSLAKDIYQELGRQSQINYMKQLIAEAKNQKAKEGQTQVSGSPAGSSGTDAKNTSNADTVTKTDTDAKTDTQSAAYKAPATADNTDTPTGK